MLGLIIGQEPSGYLGGKNGLPMHRFQRKETAADNSMRALNGPLRNEGHRSCLLFADREGPGGVQRIRLQHLADPIAMEDIVV